MGKKLIISLCMAFAFICSATIITAQGDITQFDPDKKDKWEIGINLGPSWVHGDLADNDAGGPKIGLGYGVHLRKAFDHIFSARLDLNGSTLTTEIPGASDDVKTKWFGATAMGIVTLNNFRLGDADGGKKTNVYMGAGAGMNSIKVESTPGREGVYQVRDYDKGGLGPHGAVLAGIAFKVAKNMSFGIEHKVHRTFCNRSDILDGVSSTFNGNDLDRTAENDIFHWTNLNLNFHLGKDDQVDPLYWVSPLTYIYKDVAEVKERPKLDLTDTDGDGVIDMLDQEKDTPAGAPVDTRGFALDSDGDGLADHEDKEPYSAPGYDIDREGVAQIPPPPAGLSEDDVVRIGKAQGWGAPAPVSTGIDDWFLPIIHYNFDRYDIKDTEVSKLYQVAMVMKKNPGLSIVAHGHTDKVASNAYNNVLSYNRASAAIDYIVNKFGIDRSRFVLQWGGEDSNLIGDAGRNLINRRVEFRVANGESSMGRPEGPNAGKGGSFSGNKDAGY